MSSSRNRFTWMIAILTCVSGLLVTGLSDTAPEAEASAEQPAGAPPASTPTDPAIEKVVEEVKASAPRPTARAKGACLTDESAIADMQRLKNELEEKRKELAKRETEIVAREAALNEELKKIESIRDEIKQAGGQTTAEEEAKIAKLVETFETMSPKAAAGVVSSIDERLARDAMSRISSAKLGKILSAMDSAKSARLTESLAGVARARKPFASSGAAEATTAAHEAVGVKGGEKNGNLKQIDESVAGRQPEPALGREPASQKR